MAGHCRRLEDSVGVPVIEPTQAAAAMMIGQLQKSGTRSSATDRENVTVLETRKGG
jgi:Asp/Glu/hydantoin racemase